MSMKACRETDFAGPSACPGVPGMIGGFELPTISPLRQVVLASERRYSLREQSFGGHEVIMYAEEKSV